MCLSVTGAAVAQTRGATVAVFADHYVYAGRSFDDLDQLEDAVVAVRPRGVRLEACGAGTARAHGAAAHRFRNFYLDLRVSKTDDTSCAAASMPRAMPVGQRFGLRPYGINDEAVERWWTAISMP
jgi:hypothetical protein